MIHPQVIEVAFIRGVGNDSFHAHCQFSPSFCRCGQSSGTPKQRILHPTQRPFNPRKQP